MTTNKNQPPQPNVAISQTMEDIHSEQLARPRFKPAPQAHVVPQFLPTEDGEFNGNVGELIVPPHCSGYSFVFEPGVLHVKKDGSGYIAVNEEDFVLEDDRDCEGGSIHWIARMAASEITALRDFLNGTPQQQQENAMTEDQIKHMVNRFLGWKLPKNFNPDGGVSFRKTFNEHTDHPMKHEPSGTNLLDASQAETMIRYLLEGLPPVQHVAPDEDVVETVARRIYEDAHKGMSNIWSWNDRGLDDEHPGTRERYLRYAQSAIDALAPPPQTRAAVTKEATHD